MAEEITQQPAETGGVPTWTPDQIRDILRGVFDPEIHVNIVDLGLVYDVRVEGDLVTVAMTLTSPGCPYGPYLLNNVKETLTVLKGVRDALIEVVWEPPWGPDKMSEEVRLELGFDV